MQPNFSIMAAFREEESVHCWKGYNMTLFSLGFSIFISKLINNRWAWGMVPKKEGEAMNQTKQNV